MGMMSRYLDRLGALVRGDRAAAPAVRAEPDGLHFGSQHLAWADVRRIEAYRRDAYVGDAVCLALLGSDDRVIELSEATPGWAEAADALERFLPEALPHAQWGVRVMAVPVGEAVQVYLQATGFERGT